MLMTVNILHLANILNIEHKNSCTLEVGGQISTHFLTVNLYSPPVHH